jgi:hypothetical protein
MSSPAAPVLPSCSHALRSDGRTAPYGVSFSANVRRSRSRHYFFLPALFLSHPTGAPHSSLPFAPTSRLLTTQVYHSYGDLLQQEFRRTRSLGAFFQGLTPTLVAVVPQIAITVSGEAACSRRSPTFCCRPVAAHATEPCAVM